MLYWIKRVQISKYYQPIQGKNVTLFYTTNQNAFLQMSGFGYYLITCINITIYLNNILQQILLSSQLLLTISVKFVFFKNETNHIDVH